MPKLVNKDVFVQGARDLFGPDVSVLTRAEVLQVCERVGIKQPAWLTNNPEARVGRGQYNLLIALGEDNDDDPPVTEDVEFDLAKVAMATPQVTTEPLGASLVPSRVKGYVPFGHYTDIRSILKSGRFYPTYITGLSGNGKTMMVEQVCAIEGREMVRVNITRETDEDDLIGGFRLVNGETVWHNGPVVIAMERGAVLLLDEVDLGDAKLMCLQPVLEGKPVFLKKINKLIVPAPGFTIVATANTKGKGSDDGRFVGTNVMNEAFLERFSITFEQEYPAPKVEAKIINAVLEENETPDPDFSEKLTKWSETIRKAYEEGGSTDLISTRRLVHIAQAYGIFGKNRLKAIGLCLNRFDDVTKKGFLDLYQKFDATGQPADPTAPPVDKASEFSSF